MVQYGDLTYIKGVLCELFDMCAQVIFYGTKTKNLNGNSSSSAELFLF